MGDLRRRDVLTAGSLLLTGSLAGCAGLVDGAEQLPAEIPLYGQNDRDDHVSLAYWVSTTASTPDGVALDGVAQLEAGEARKLTRIPVEAPSDGTNSPLLGRLNERTDIRTVVPPGQWLTLLLISCIGTTSGTSCYRSIRILRRCPRRGTLSPSGAR
jgi:hypothetical protein